jgi:uncharacterized repeat protein (TIGR03837 family)
MSQPRTWDIFCRVVDNFGDAAVCWRLARQLSAEHHASVRLWIDDLSPLHALCREVKESVAQQTVAGIAVCAWPREWTNISPADIVIEAFGCGLPEAYVAAMAQASPHPVWLVLEYLSAEPWVPEHHGLPSPHPSWGIPRYFFFPGFVAGTGGVLREKDLTTRRDRFGMAARRTLWQATGFDKPEEDATVVSVFSYDTAPLGALFSTWESSAHPVVAGVPQGKCDALIAAHFGKRGVQAGQHFQRGGLEVRVLPFMEQGRYDETLWSCDVNFVRGEDSFVRAQWAGRPLVWQIYEQAEGAHWRKLDAFLDLYCASLPPSAAERVCAMWRAWNGASGIPVHDAWDAYWEHRAELTKHAQAWARRLAAGPELAAKLAEFCSGRLKY